MAPHVTRRSALDIAERAPISRDEKFRILALPYPVEHQAFWRVLGDMGMTQQRLMEHMGASL